MFIHNLKTRSVCFCIMYYIQVYYIYFGTDLLKEHNVQYTSFICKALLFGVTTCLVPWLFYFCFKCSLYSVRIYVSLIRKASAVVKNGGSAAGIHIVF